MSGALHLIDDQTETDAMHQLSAVIGPGDRVAAIGPMTLPAWWSLPVRRLRKPLGLAALAGQVATDVAGGAELVHAWSIPAAQAGEAIARNSGCPAILHLPHFPAPDCLDRLVMLASWGKLRLTVPTEACRRRLCEAGIDGSVMYVLPPVAAVVDRRDERRAGVRRALGLTEEQRLIVAPGRLTRAAGHKYACWVLAVLRQILDGVRLLIPGDGPVRSSVHYFASTLGYDREIFLAAERFTLQEALAAADLAVFFACGDCGLGALASALAVLPVVALATADVEEMTGGGQAAMLCPVGDVRAASAAVLRLIQDPFAAKALSAAGAAWAEPRFSPAAARKNLAEILAAIRQGAPA
jgi:glycosyltransferase involved in cell wall biosynthesis